MSDFCEVFVPSSGSDIQKGATIVINGLDSIPGQLDPVVDHFSRSGDVFAYTYSKEVVTSGNPARLPKLVGDLCMRVSDIESDYGQDKVRTVGASLGACIAMNIQDRLGLTTPGVYGAAGVNVANNFMLNPVFRYYKIPQLFEERGYALDSIKRLWKDIDLQDGREISDSMRFWANASVLDPVVWYPIAKRNLRPYIANGTCVLQRSKAILHTATINEMAKNIAEATEIADNIKRI